MLNNNRTKKIVISFAVVNVFLSLVYGGLFFGFNQKNKEAALAYSSLFHRESDKLAFDRLEKTLLSTEKQRVILDDYVITPTESLSFIEQIENLGKTTFTDVKVIALSSPKKAGDPFSLDFTAKGKFENVYQVLSLVEEMPFNILIKKVKMTADTKEKIWDASFTIVLRSYRM